MLYKETVETTTLELLASLQQEEILKDFFLVGGTALSLQIGHRISVDLDLFTQKPFDTENVLTVLEKKYNYHLDFQSKNSLKGEIGGVKVDLIAHQYLLCQDLIIINNIRMATLLEISAMKLNAIMVNGTRLKDFIDIAFLSGFLSLNDMINAYEIKYQTRNTITIIKSVSYFSDINYNEPIKLVATNFEWFLIENRLRKIVANPNQIFDKKII
jgi:hypothetical protein